MRLPKFDHYQPATVEEAVDTLGANPGARLLAGGTDLLVNMKHRVETPPVIVSLKKIGSLRGIGAEDGATVIGANTTLKQIQNDAGLARALPRAGRGGSGCGFVSTPDHGHPGREHLPELALPVLQSVAGMAVGAAPLLQGGR